MDPSISATGTRLFGVIVYESAKDLDDQQISLCSMAFMCSAGANMMESLPFLNVAAEGIEEKEVIENEGVHMIRCHEDAFDMFREISDEATGSEQEGCPARPNGNVELAIGSSTFCGAFIHYVATQPGGLGEDWGFWFLRHLLSRKHGEALWLNCDEKKFEEGKLQDMYRHYQDSKR